MNGQKLRIFKCKKPLCCDGSWVVACGIWTQKLLKTHAEAVTYAAKEAAS